MAITWDTPTTCTSTTFTTARTFAHTVGGGNNRYIWVGISTEDYSTGGAAQTPSSVTYGGNALVGDGIITAGSVQTSTIYSGQDATMGTAGSHNVVITYAGEVDALVAFAVSCDEMKQQVKEATGSTVSLNSTNTGGTSSITTLTNGAVIMAMAGNDNNAAGKTTTWNVGTEVGDDVSTGVAGAMLRYELATAGAQSITATVVANVTRFCLVSFAYEVASNTNPVITVPGAQRYVIGVAEVVSGISIADADNDESVLTLTCTKGTWAAPTPTNVDVSGSGTATMTLTGTTTELNTYLAAGNGPTYTHSTANHDADTLTINIDDQVGTPDEDTITVTAVDWKIVGATLAAVNETFRALQVTASETGSTTLSLYTEDSGGRTGTTSTILTISNALIGLWSLLQKRRRKWI